MLDFTLFDLVSLTLKLEIYFYSFLRVFDLVEMVNILYRKS